MIANWTSTATPPNLSWHQNLVVTVVAYILAPSGAFKVLLAVVDFKSIFPYQSDGLTHWGLEMPYGDIDLGQHCFR